MILGAGYGPFPSGRTYFVEKIEDPSSPDVHAQYALVYRQGENGLIQRVAPSVEPRTLWAASDWRDTHLPNPTTDPDDRPLVRLPALPGSPPDDVFAVGEVHRMIMADFVKFIEDQERDEDGSPTEPEPDAQPTGDGLDDLDALFQSMDADWKRAIT